MPFLARVNPLLKRTLSPRTDLTKSSLTRTPLPTPDCKAFLITNFVADLAAIAPTPPEAAKVIASKG